MINNLRRLLAAGVIVALLPAFGWSQTTDRSEVDQWVKDTASQGELPLGTQKLFAGTYFWKIPQDAELDIGPTINNFLPPTWKDATEKYGPQTTVEVLPN